MTSELTRSQALWNVNTLDLENVEVLAQIMDRGSLSDWKQLARIATNEERLRRRMKWVVENAPLSMPWLWVSWLRGQKERFDENFTPPKWEDSAV